MGQLLVYYLRLQENVLNTCSQAEVFASSSNGRERCGMEKFHMNDEFGQKHCSLVQVLFRNHYRQ